MKRIFIQAIGGGLVGVGLQYDILHFSIGVIGLILVQLADLFEE